AAGDFGLVLALARDLGLHRLLLGVHLLVDLRDDVGFHRAHVALDLDPETADQVEHRLGRHLHVLGDLVDAQLLRSVGGRHPRSSSSSPAGASDSAPVAGGVPRCAGTTSGSNSSSISTASGGGPTSSAGGAASGCSSDATACAASSFSISGVKPSSAGTSGRCVASA